jgi:hypothetical protein
MRVAERLSQKGWTSVEIEHAVHHFHLAEQRKHPYVRLAEVSVYWIYLLILVVGTLAISKLFFPLLAILPITFSLITLGVLGSVFGILFAHVLHEYDLLSRAHHVGVLVGVVLASVGGAMSGGYWLFSGVFAGLFVLDYAYYWWHV